MTLLLKKLSARVASMKIGDGLEGGHGSGSTHLMHQPVKR